jgi:hypothetical protein
MAGPGIDAIYNYLSLLIAERTPDDPLSVRQVMPALHYKFPDFSFERYGMEGGIIEFIRKGEQAGFFKLMNAGDLQTAYLGAGPRRPPAAPPPPPKNLNPGDKHQMRWMTATMEGLLRSDRGDQILEAVRDVEWQTPAFEEFLNAEERAMTLYSSRGKLRRVRDFLTTLRDLGEAQAITNWQSSRSLLRMPPVPPHPSEAPRAQALIWALLQGQASLAMLPPDQINAMFFAVLIFCRDQLRRERAWDWVAGLDILEAEARSLRGAGPALQKKSLLTIRTGKLTPDQTTQNLGDATVMALVSQLRKEAGIRTTLLDPTPLYKGFADTPSLDQSFQYLENRSTLLADDGLLNWLEAEIAKHVAAGNDEPLRKLANKAAMVIGARKHGLPGLKQQPMELKSIYETVLQGIALLKHVFSYLKQATHAQAAQFLRDNPDLLDEEAVGPLLDEQLLKAAQTGMISSFRQLSERVVLWEKITNLGFEEGVRQYEREFAPRTDTSLQAEMGILLLVRTQDVAERYDIMERFPASGTQEGLRMIESMLEMLYFQNADQEQYGRHHEVKHLIERCIRVGIDRALSELRQ